MHVHSEFSLLDGAVRINDILDHAEKEGCNAIAMTDNGVMYGVIDFYLAAKERGIKAIIGCELYLSPDIEEKTRELSRLIVLCKSYKGYENLSEIVSLSHIDGFYYKPRIDLKHIAAFTEDLVVISPGMSGPVAELIKDHKMESAEEMASELNTVFKNNFYLGIQSLGVPFEDLITEESHRISEAQNIPLIATNDVYYPKPEDAINREILRCIQFGRTIDLEDTAHRHQSQYLKSSEEMIAAFEKYPEAIENTMKVAEVCNTEFNVAQVQLPNFECPDNLSSEAYLEKLVWEGINRKYPEITKEIKERVGFELEIIIKMDYPIYFLIIYDFLKFCSDNQIPVGPGRGSAAGSIIAYALDITLIDPLKYNLLFERFLNPERVSMPDVDLDFCIKRRGEVIDYIVEKYGSAHVAQIATFGTMQARAVVRDVGRVLAIPLNEVDRIAKLIPATPGNYTSIEEALETVPELKADYDRNPNYKQLLDFGKRLEGFSRHSSTHAAGVVISKNPLSTGVPLMKNDGQIATQYNMNVLEKLGLLKMDILGLRNLTVIDDTLKLIEKRSGEKLDIANLPVDDKETYELLSSGATMGIFQLESQGMRELIKNLAPSTFEDIIALLALYRPGPLGSGMVNDFISNKSGKTTVKYDFPELEPVLKDTYGMILYQEQVMQIASVIGGFSLAQADMLRRAMGKKKKSVMDQMKTEFLDGAKAKALNIKKAEKVFELCYKFAEYGFNKSHSAAYALISYQTSYLKQHHPIEYMASLLSSVAGNSDKSALYIKDASDRGLAVLPPDINHSIHDFSCNDDGIRVGLGSIKNVGDNAIQSIVDNREKKPYDSLLDFCCRVDLRQTNKRVIESLIKCGAFNSISENRGLLLAQLEPTLDFAQAKIKEINSGQTNLFGDSLQPSMPTEETFDDFMSEMEKLKHEKELLGAYISGHPLEQFKEELERMIYHSQSFKEEHNNQTVTLFGILKECRRILTKKNKEMVMGVLEDTQGEISALAFQSDDFQEIADDFQDDNIVRLTGKIRLKEEKASLFIERIDVIDDILKPKIIHVDLEEMDDLSHYEAIRQFCKENRGDTPLQLHIGKHIILVNKKYWIDRDVKENLKDLVRVERIWEA